MSSRWPESFLANAFLIIFNSRAFLRAASESLAALAPKPLSGRGWPLGDWPVKRSEPRGALLLSAAGRPWRCGAPAAEHLYLHINAFPFSDVK